MKFRKYTAVLTALLMLTIATFAFARTGVQFDDMGLFTGPALFSRYTDLDDLVTTLGPGGISVTVVVNQQMNMGAVAVVVPANITLDFKRQGAINITALQTVTFTSPGQIIAPPDRTIFVGAGALINVVFTDGGITFPEYFGPIDNVDDEVQMNAAANALPSGIVHLSSRTYVIGLAASIIGKSNVKIEGEGYGTLLTSTGNRGASMIQFDTVTNVFVENIRFDSNDSTGRYSQVNLTGNSSGLKVQNNWFIDGWSGVWIEPDTNDTITDVEISNNNIDSCNRGIILGNWDLTGAFPEPGVLGDTINDVRIIGNNIINNSGDGLKYSSSVFNVTVIGNTISGSGLDAIDGYVSGDRTTITGNILRHNTMHGVDLKHREGNYPEAAWGWSRNIIIANNVMDGNFMGVRTSGLEDLLATDFAYYITIDGNIITNSTSFGMHIQSSFIAITNNIVTANGLLTAAGTDTYGIRLEGSAVGDMHDIVISGNVVVNNGNAVIRGMGIFIRYVSDSVTISDNIISSDPDQPNDNQLKGLFIDDTSDGVLIVDNAVSGHATFDVQIEDTAGVQGEMSSHYIGTIAAGVTDERPIFRAPSNCLLVNAYVINASDIAQNNAVYETLRVYDRGPAGVAADIVFVINTTIATGVAILDFDSMSMGDPDATDKFLAEGDVLSFSKTPTGGGQGLDEMVVILNYITY